MSDVQEVKNETQEETVEETQQIEQPEEVKQPEPTPEPERPVISLGDEQLVEPEEIAKAPEWVKELRKANREKERKIKELEQKLNTQQDTSDKKRETLGQKPTLESLDYDADKYETALGEWIIKKQRVEQQIEADKRAEQEQAQAWQNRLNDYEKAKKELPVEDYDDAFAKLSETFNQTQLGIVIQGATNPALVLYALGKKPERAAALAKIADPVKFSFAIAELQGEIKMENKPKAPPPETRVTGTGGGVSSTDKQLESLEREAERTGDRTKILDYKRHLRQ